MRYWWPVFLILIIIICLCNTHNYSYPPSFEEYNFPLLKQPDGVSCGPTSATMLANYYGQTVTLDEIRKTARTDWFEFKGQSVGLTIPGQIAIALKQHGIDAKCTIGTIDSLKQNISISQYPIVLLRSGPRLWHYVVAIGYSEDTIVVADPGYGIKQKMSLKTFMDAWNFEADMDGKRMDTIMPPLLMVAGVNKNTMIVPKAKKTP